MTHQQLEEQKAESANWNRVREIARIVQAIRIKPPTPPSKKSEFYPMVDVDLPEEKGGVRVYWRGLERPTKTFPYKETVEQIDDMKKVIMASVRSFSAMFKDNPVKTLLLLFFFRKEIENTALDMLAEFHVRLREVKNKNWRYSTAVKEIHRTFDATKSNYKVRDLVCMVGEYDDAYRYRAQDAFVYLDKEAVKKDVVKELGRILDILSDKEGEEIVMKPKWLKMKKMLLILRFKKDLRNKVRDFLLELNLEEMKMDTADIYHSGKKPNFWWHYLKERPLPK